MAKAKKTTKHSKRFNEIKSKVDRSHTYSVEEAIALVKETATTKFDSSIEVHLRTAIDPKKGDQVMRGTINLPHGSGKKPRIAVIVPDDRAKEFKDCGADMIGGSELIDAINKTGKTDFDVLLTTPDNMANIAKLAKVLGPKGLMPNPKTDTVTPNIKKAVDELAKGKITYKNDDGANIHLIIGKASFDTAKLIENFESAMDAIKKAKPSGIKGNLIKSGTITSSMGPGIKVSVA